jgi:hypothetical protein
MVGDKQPYAVPRQYGGGNWPYAVAVSAALGMAWICCQVG